MTSRSKTPKRGKRNIKQTDANEPSAASRREMLEIDWTKGECIRYGPRPGPSANPFVSLRLLRYGGCFLSGREVMRCANLTTRELKRIEAKGDGWLSILGRYAKALGGELAVSIKIGEHTFPISFESSGQHRGRVRGDRKRGPVPSVKTGSHDEED